MQETEAAGEPTLGRSFGLHQHNASNTKLHCGKLAGPGFTIGVGGLSLWDGHKVPTIIWYPTTNNRQRGILHPNIMLESRERETLRSTLPFFSVQVLYHTGK
jgi:hypothetical protein